MPIEWTPERIEIVRTMYPNSTYEEIAALIPNLSYPALQTKARRLGVVKSEKYRLAVIDKAIANSVNARKGKATWNAQNHPEIICQSCGKTFTVLPYRKDEAKYCSSTCFGKGYKGQLAGEKSPRYKQVKHICVGCGKSFMVQRIYHDAGKYRYCSNACRYPEHVYIACKWCDKPIKVTPGARDRGRKQFCSQGCHGAYTVASMQTEATSIEKAVEQVLIDLNEPYIAQKPMASWLVDFYLPQYRLIIECDGTYWHKLPNVIKKDQNKDHWLKAHKYNLLRISEEAIKLDAMKAVIDGLHSLSIPL